ncbi:MAG TPA: carboxypeptidase-like regulatory domain-containing protein, partial [Thermoanaerobaculia bacterium]|nr:carboxypeptidase-like regulatory domain-containing protein [Thermoanaerobaculia bacterium]
MRRLAISAGVALALWSLPLAAQPWVGTAAVGLEVADRGGRLVAGAEVELSFTGSEEGGGPGAVLTDGEGRASVRGLAEGRWTVQVLHPDYMAYVADLEVRSGRRPRERSASLVKVGDSLESVRVRYFAVEGAPRRPPPPPPAPRPVAPPAPAPAPPAPLPEPVPVPLPAPPPAAEPAPVPAPPEPAPPAPLPEPVPAPAPQAAHPAPLPPPEPPPPVRAPAPVPAPPLPGPEPTPEPPPAPEPPRAADPVPPPAVPEPSRFLRSFRDGTCPECQPGEWAVTLEATAGGTGEGCPQGLSARISGLAMVLRADASSLIAGYAGPVSAATGAPGLDRAAGARCQVLPVHLPEGARFVAFQFEAMANGRLQ